MSWYTIIFPDKSDYVQDKYGTIDEMIERTSELETKKDDVWRYIASCAVMTPYSEDGKSVIESMTNLFTKYWDEYIRLSEEQNKLAFSIGVYEDQEYHDERVNNGYADDEDDEYEFTDENGNTVKEWRPSYSYNHYEYNYGPDEGVKETQKIINNIRTKLTSLACATPKDIITANNDDDIFDIIGYRVSEYKEILDETLFTNFFSRMCVKYWGTHTEG